MRAYLRFALTLSALALGACANSSGPSDGSPPVTTPDAAVPDAGSTTSCASAADCAWTEIGIEILSHAQCPCLLGCPNIPVNRATQARRAAQYAALCTPGQNGTGGACGEDDCALPPAIACTASVCQGP